MVAVSYIVTISFIGGGSQLSCDSQLYWWWQSVILWQSVLLVVAVSYFVAISFIGGGSQLYSQITDGGSQLSCGNTTRLVGDSIFHNGDQNNMTEFQPGINFLGVQNTTHYKSFNLFQTASVV